MVIQCIFEILEAAVFCNMVYGYFLIFCCNSSSVNPDNVIGNVSFFSLCKLAVQAIYC